VRVSITSIGLALAACGTPAPPTAPVASHAPFDAAPAPRPDPTDPLEDSQIVPRPRGTVVVSRSDSCGLILQPVYFEQDSANVGADQVAAVDAIADMFVCLEKENGLLLRLAIQGYADAAEKDPDQVSLARAQTVATMLTARKMPTLGPPFELVPYGAREMADRTGTADGRARNRRVHFLILERRTKP
jgi:outer membrane protein OmpA-like peptidoglycan-associated protein